MHKLKGEIFMHTLKGKVELPEVSEPPQPPSIDWASQWYGFELDEANSSPDLVRIGSDMTEHNGEYLHAVLPVHSQIKACLLLPNGTVNYYLDPADWGKKENGTASDLSGADGNVMVEFPTYYRRVDSPSPGVYQHKISLSPLSGYQKVDKFYIGAYKATVNRTGVQKLWSVVNTTPEFRGGNNNASLDNQDNTLLGKPASYLTLPALRLRARNIVPGEYKWNLVPYRHSMLLYELFIIEYATRNSQKAVNTVLTSEGYKQGGLGNGVTTVDSNTWNNFNEYFPLIPCGTSNSLASGTGEVAYTIPSFGHASGAVKVNRYRGIECPFGDIWEWCDGASIYNEGAGGVSKFYTCDIPQNFADGTATNYEHRANLPVGSTYPIKMTHDDKGIFIPNAGGGYSTIYWCDYYHTSGLVNAWRALIRGGYAFALSDAGFVYLFTNHNATSQRAYFGARLCYLP